MSLKAPRGRRGLRDLPLSIKLQSLVAVMLLALLAIVFVLQNRTALAPLAYMILFGGGPALAMAALPGLAGVPLAHLARARRGLPTVLAASGTLSLALGLAWGWTAIR